MLLEAFRNREEQRPAARHDDAFSGYGPPSFRQGVQASGPDHAWQCPAGERQEYFARAGRDDEFFPGDGEHASARLVRCENSAAAAGIEYRYAGKDLGAACLQAC